MNGQEINHLLDLIDANMAENDLRVRRELIQFIAAHEDQVVSGLRHGGSVAIPTSFGDVTLRSSDLERMLAAA